MEHGGTGDRRRGLQGQQGLQGLWRLQGLARAWPGASHGRLLAALVVMALAFTLFTPAGCLAGTGQKPDSIGRTASAVGNSLIEGLARHGSGWGLLSPALLISGKAASDAVKGEGFAETKALIKNPRLWLGTGASVLGTRLMLAVAQAMPGGIFVRTAVAASGSFLGWELGTSFFGETDWVSLTAQVLAAAGAQLAVASAMGCTGFMAGGWVAAAASIGAAILVGIAVDKLRGKSLDPALEADVSKVPGKASMDDRPIDIVPLRAPSGSGTASTTAAAGLADTQRVWAEKLRALQAAPGARALEEFRQADEAYRKARGAAR